MFIFRPMRSKNGTMMVSPGCRVRVVFAELLDGPIVALRHGLDAREQRQDRERDKGDREDIEAEHGSALSKRFPAFLSWKTRQPNKVVAFEMWRKRSRAASTVSESRAAVHRST